jgi:ABC-2 type transport system ATP-binding protein
MDAASVRAHGISKRFSGHVAAERVSFEVRRGEVFALLGPNGAGKTTTVRMLIGIIRPDEGRIEVPAGGAVLDRLPPERTGYLPEDRGLYQELPILRSLGTTGSTRSPRATSSASSSLPPSSIARRSRFSTSRSPGSIR